jgi:hypothetical protein
MERIIKKGNFMRPMKKDGTPQAALMTLPKWLKDLWIDSGATGYQIVEIRKEGGITYELRPDKVQ